MTFQKDYMRGLDALYDYAPYFYRIMRFLGIPAENPQIATAQVSYDPYQKKILFEINPALISDMDDEQVGFVIAHEAYHVLLRHLMEIQDTQDYPDQGTLIIAHEAIVNDTVQNVLGLDAPAMDIIFGDKYGADFSGFSTREAYDWIHQDSENDDSGSDGDDESQDNENDSDGNNNDDTSQGQGTGNSSSANSPDDSENLPHACGGVVVPEGYEDDFMKAVAGSLGDAIQDIKSENEDIPDEMLDALEDLGDSMGIDITKGYGIGSNNGSMFAGKMDDMNLDWKMLIAEINPKVMTSGGPKYKDSWTSPNRRMISVYPKVIVPNRVRKKDSGDTGDETPTFILALDMSYSIPEYLIDGLANLADTVPDKFVKVLPITWADSVLEFDTQKKRIINRGGTNINGVWDYSQKVKKQIGHEPYVFVITDGECEFDSRYYYTASWNNKDNKTVNDYWYWGAIDSRSVNSIKNRMRNQVDPSKIYRVDDFLV